MSWFRKNRSTETSDTDSASDPLVVEAQIVSRQTAEIRRFKSTIVGDLTEPKVVLEHFIFGWIAIVGLFLVGIILCFFYPIWLIIPVTLLVIAIVIFVLGIRCITSVHNGLLYNYGRRTRIGFWEGYVWIPWLTGGKLKEINVEHFSYDIAREDTWTKDQMHILFDLVIRFGVISVAERDVWTNFFWFFHVWFKTDTYYDYLDEEVDLGEGIFQFMENPDVENALILVIADAKESVRKILRTKGFEEVFNFTDDTVKVDPTITELVEQEIEDLMQHMLCDKAKEIGLRISQLALADIDFNKDAIKALQQKKVKPILAKAEVLAYDELIKIGQKLSLNTSAGEATLRTQIITALKDAANSVGVLGPLISGTTLEKVASISQLPESKIITQTRT